jgi:hypothetical protein
VTGNVFRQPYFHTDYGGAYVTGSDSPDDYFFQVTDAVKQIDVFLTGGTQLLRIRCFAIYAVDNGMAATWVGYEEGVPGANLAVEVPTEGTWQAGRILYNAVPTVVKPIGRVSTQGGIPGIWAPFNEVGM